MLDANARDHVLCARTGGLIASPERAVRTRCLDAYAVLTDGPPDGLAGAQILIDGGGWLRALQRPVAAPGWDNPSTLADAVRDIEA